LCACGRPADLPGAVEPEARSGIRPERIARGSDGARRSLDWPGHGADAGRGEALRQRGGNVSVITVVIRRLDQPQWSERADRKSICARCVPRHYSYTPLITELKNAPADPALTNPLKTAAGTL